MGPRVIQTLLRVGNAAVFTGLSCEGSFSRRLSTLLLHVRPLSISSNMAYTSVERGSPNTEDFRVFFKNAAGIPISPFHDIPLRANSERNTFNMVVEIPRWSNAKMEVCKEERLNPIKQDVKKGALRYVKNIFPHHGYIWNYGALPQTFEDPNVTTPDTGALGDADPIDVCEIGSKIATRGAVIEVKPIGVMCLIDEGETDWKVLAIDVTDSMAEKINDVQDIEVNFPGLLRATYEWFKYYKVPDGKPENQFAFNGEAKNKEYALKVIEETHDQWKTLMASDSETSIARENVSVAGSPNLIDNSEAEKIFESSPLPGSAEEVSQTTNKWHYVLPQ